MRSTQVATARTAALCAGLCVAVGAGLSGCSQTPEGNDTVVDKSWQVIGIYTAADAPGFLPDSVSQAPSVTFGNRGMVGTTGCAQFRAQTSYFHDDEQAHPEDADRVSIDSIEFAETRADCADQSLWAHNQLTRLLNTGHEFEMRVDSTNQLVLTLIDDAVDSPAIRFASLNFS